MFEVYLLNQLICIGWLNLGIFLYGVKLLLLYCEPEDVYHFPSTVFTLLDIMNFLHVMGTDFVGFGHSNKGRN